MYTPSPLLLPLLPAGAALLLFVVLLVYWLGVYARPLWMARRREQIQPTEEPPISVILYAANESENLQRTLPALLTQDYPAYEVIVVNDGSTDESHEVLKRYEAQYPHLYHTYIPEETKYVSRKKLSLTVGIKAAHNERLLFTEANCTPRSNQWLRTVAAAYHTPGTEVVLGFCAYGHYRGFFHKLVAYDNLVDGLQYLASALGGHPFSGNGRNLSYCKELFFKHKGFKKSLNLHAGHDDLFVNEVATRQNTQVVYSPDSIVEMAQLDSFAVWKEMKMSRASTRRHYEGRQQLHYRFESVCNFLLLLATVASVVFGFTHSYISLVGVLPALILYVVKAVVLHKSARMLQQRPLTGWLPLLDMVRPLFRFYVRIYRLFRGKTDYTFRYVK